jgi:hypothetical protein
MVKKLDEKKNSRILSSKLDFQFDCEYLFLFNSSSLLKQLEQSEFIESLFITFLEVTFDEA